MNKEFQTRIKEKNLLWINYLPKNCSAEIEIFKYITVCKRCNAFKYYYLFKDIQV